MEFLVILIVLGILVVAALSPAWKNSNPPPDTPPSWASGSEYEPDYEFPCAVCGVQRTSSSESWMYERCFECYEKHSGIRERLWAKEYRCNSERWRRRRIKDLQEQGRESRPRVEWKCLICEGAIAPRELHIVHSSNHAHSACVANADTGPMDEDVFRCKVAGVTFENRDGVNRQEALSEVARQGAISIQVERESGNAHDSNAVLVLANGLDVGYVPREIAADLAPYLDAGKTATVSLDKFRLPYPDQYEEHVYAMEIFIDVG